MRQEACRLYWSGRRREIPTGDVSRLVCALQLVAMLLRDVELEQRVAALEAMTP